MPGWYGVVFEVPKGGGVEAGGVCCGGGCTGAICGAGCGLMAFLMAVERGEEGAVFPPSGWLPLTAPFGSICHGSWPILKVRPSFEASDFAFTGRLQRSAANPLLCIDLPGGATFFRAAASLPYFATAFLKRIACVSGERYALLIQTLGNLARNFASLQAKSPFNLLMPFAPSRELCGPGRYRCRKSG